MYLLVTCIQVVLYCCMMHNDAVREQIRNRSAHDTMTTQYCTLYVYLALRARGSSIALDAAAPLQWCLVYVNVIC